MCRCQPRYLFLLRPFCVLFIPLNFVCRCRNFLEGCRPRTNTTRCPLQRRATRWAFNQSLSAILLEQLELMASTLQIWRDCLAIFFPTGSTLNLRSLLLCPLRHCASVRCTPCMSPYLFLRCLSCTPLHKYFGRMNVLCSVPGFACQHRKGEVRRALAVPHAQQRRQVRR